MRARAGWALAVAVGLATAVTPRPPAAPAPSPVIVRAAGYGAAELELPVRPPAVPVVEHRTARTPAATVDWDLLAACESGEWVNGGKSFVPGSAVWDDRSLHRGGLQFARGTWAAYRDPWMPADAADATRTQQVTVAERVLAAQGPVAWPRCTQLLGWR